MFTSKNLIGCAVILFFLASTAHTLSLSSHEQAYDASLYVRGRNQVINPCFRVIPADTRTKLSWSKTDNSITITSCSDVPSQETVRHCLYTLGSTLTTTGTEFHLTQCNVTKQGTGCADPVPGYIVRLQEARQLELHSDRYNFRTGPNGKIVLVTQTK